MQLEEIPVRYDPKHPEFGIFKEPYEKKQHQNQQRGLDIYIGVINFTAGEKCHKKLYRNRKGLHFKHSGYSPMYLDDFSRWGIVYPFQVDLN